MGSLGAADDLAVALHGFAGGDIPEGDLVAGGDGVAHGDGEPIDAQFGAGGEGDAGDGDVVGGVEVDDGVLGVGDLGDFDEHGVPLSFELQFAGGLFEVSVQAVAGGVDPDAVAIVGDGDFGGVFHDDEFFIFDIGEELADVDVEVALRAPLGGIESEAPALVAPVFAGLGDGGGPEGRCAVRGSCR